MRGGEEGTGGWGAGSEVLWKTGTRVWHLQPKLRARYACCAGNRGLEFQKGKARMIANN
jgi:hypothetical protein